MGKRKSEDKPEKGKKGKKGDAKSTREKSTRDRMNFVKRQVGAGYRAAGTFFDLFDIKNWID